MDDLFPPFAPDPNEPRPRRFKPVPFRMIAPNMITLMALCLGLTAIRLAFEGKFEPAVIAVVVAGVLDGIDGRVARLLKGTSRFGAELDSLADFVNFGCAPALIVYGFSLFHLKSFGWIVALIFAIAMALRLARFNVALDDPDRPAWASNFFTGMPAPAGAITALLPLYLHLSALGWVFERWAVALEILYLLGIAGLMASRIPFFSGKSIGRVPREQVIPVLFGVAVVVLLLVTYPMEVLAAAVALFLALVPFSIRAHRRCRRRDAERAVA